MTRRIQAGGLVLLFAFLLAISFSAHAEIAARLVRVIDGDTLVVRTPEGNRIIALTGIDAPETGEPFAARTRQEVVNLTRQNILQLRPDGSERGGRPGAEVFLLDGRSLNRELVAAGLARAREDSALGKELKALEERARNEKRGLWAAPAKQQPKALGHQGKVTTRAKPVTAPKPSTANAPFAVFIEPGRSVYHLRGCRVLKGETVGFPLQMARENHLVPCNVCRPPF